MQRNRRTALHDVHQEHGARFGAFAGWEMPIFYSGISAEHRAVRSAAGLFDVSHMGEFLVRGESALELLQHLTINDVSRLQDGQAQYSAFLSPAGTILDDILVYRIESRSYMLVVNAANVDKDWNWIESHNRWGAVIENASDRTALVAVQGPRAHEILDSLTDLNLSEMRYYHCAWARVSGIEGILSRTGYTGEDGFEFYFDSEHAVTLWRALVAAGSGHGLLPAGLGARNTLRLEAAMLLYGNDIDETVTPLEAGLERITKMDKAAFIGKDSLVALKQAGIRKKLVGFQMRGASIAREGDEVLVDGQRAGRVTSGGPSITLRRNIGLAYLPAEHGLPGSLFEVRVRRRLCEAEVAPTPFYKRGYRYDA